MKKLGSIFDQFSTAILVGERSIHEHLQSEHLIFSFITPFIKNMRTIQLQKASVQYHCLLFFLCTCRRFRPPLHFILWCNFKFCQLPCQIDWVRSPTKHFADCHLFLVLFLFLTWIVTPYTLTVITFALVLTFDVSTTCAEVTFSSFGKSCPFFRRFFVFLGRFFQVAFERKKTCLDGIFTKER